jgi:hypothetical protein
MPTTWVDALLHKARQGRRFSLPSSGGIHAQQSPPPSDS